MYSPSSRPGSSAWRSAPARSLCWAFALLVLWQPARLPALTPSETVQIASLLEESRQLQLGLKRLRELSTEQTLRATELAQKLERMQQDGQMLDAKLRLWQEHSTELSDSLETLSSELATSRSSLAQARSGLDALSKDYSAYKLVAEKRILLLDSSARRWRIAAVAGIFGALAAGLLAGLLIK